MLRRVLGHPLPNSFGAADGSELLACGAELRRCALRRQFLYDSGLSAHTLQACKGYGLQNIASDSANTWVRGQKGPGLLTFKANNAILVLHICFIGGKDHEFIFQTA